MDSRIQILDWDSDFFGFKTAKIDLSQEELLEEDYIKLLQNIKQLNIKCTYLFVTPNTTADQYLKANDFFLADQKAIFSCSLNEANTNSAHTGHIHKFNTDIFIYSDLLDQALSSGIYSRFKLDSYFPEGSFENLYKAWIDKSIARDEVLVYEIGNQVKGFIAYSMKENTSHIDLIAVSTEARGKGIGTALIDHLKRMCLQSAVTELKVVTQLINTPACSLYYRNNFILQNVTNIYHIWNHDTI